MKPQKIEHLKDIQNEPDSRKIGIERVGVKNLRYPIQIRDQAHGLQNTIAAVTLAVDLPHQFKGAHMSRFLETLNARGPVIHVEAINSILLDLQKKLHSENAHVEFDFPFFLEKRAPVTGIPGLMDYNVRFSASAVGSHFDFVVTTIVPVTTLCPCSKAISEHGAHNQRGLVTYSVRFHRPIWVEELIALVEASASCELYSILKRPDEKAVTERAYQNPVFVEDLVRNVAARSNAEPNIQWWRVEAETIESIHNHNAYAIAEKK